MTSVGRQEHVSIRLGRRDDANELFRLASVLATSNAPIRQAFDVSLEAIIADETQLILVATREAEDTGAGLVGFLHGLTHPAFHANDNVGWIEELVVDEGCRGFGIGKKLMAWFEDWSLSRAVDTDYLALATRRAAGFYRSLGYEESAAYLKKSLKPARQVTGSEVHP